MSDHSSALASLIASYTDSEGEEEGVGEEKEKSQNDDSSNNCNNSNGATAPARVVPRSLVSYYDDTEITDEEEEVMNDSAEQERQKLVHEGESRDGICLPPEPTGHCSNALQEKITRLHKKMQSSGLDMNEAIQQRKEFRNPSIYEKLVQFCNINESGTNYPPETYDPLQWGKESFYEELARAQNIEMNKREKERRNKTKVEFVTGTVKRLGSGSGAECDARRRKSKWDQVVPTVAATMTRGPQATHVFRPPGLINQPSLASRVTGTKGTVISAFGSLAKRTSK